MSTKNKRDLIKYLAANAKICEEFMYEVPRNWVCKHWQTGEPYDTTPEDFKRLRLKFEFVEHYGGQGQGDEYWTVYKFTTQNDEAPNEEFYIQFEGFYQSYNGADFTGFREVTPREKTVTVYE